MFFFKNEVISVSVLSMGGLATNSFGLLHKIEIQFSFLKRAENNDLVQNSIVCYTIEF